MINRREILKGTGGAALLAASGLPRLARAERRDSLNILCWEGYNTGDVLDPFRRAHPGVKVNAESGTSDPDMINKLRAGEIKVWDIINVNQPWARAQLLPEKLIKPLDRAHFEPYFDTFLKWFKGPYPYALDAEGKNLIGMAQRFGPFSFVVNTNKISRKMAEDQGFKIFLDPKLKGRYGVLTYDNWNIMHMCITADIDPFKKHSEAEIAAYEKVARRIFKGAKLLSDDLVGMNTALVNGEIDAYFTGGTYTASPARFDGERQIRGITPKSGPIGGKGGIVWAEVTSLVNNPNPSALGAAFLDYVHQPDVCKNVAFAEGTYNPIADLGNPKVFAKFNKEELDAIQWDSLDDEMANSAEFSINPDFDRMMTIYTAAKRSA